jgi:hypothetical protein
MDDVELDGSTATRLHIYEQQPLLRSEHIARVWLAVQQLLGGPPLTYGPPQLSQCVAQKFPIRIPEFRSTGAVINQPLRLRDSIRDVRRREIDLPHASVQLLERVCILGRRNLARRHRLIIRPQGDYKPVTHIDARLHPRLKRSHGATGFGEPPSDLNFELGA